MHARVVEASKLQSINRQSPVLQYFANRIAACTRGHVHPVTLLGATDAKNGVQEAGRPQSQQSPQLSALGSTGDSLSPPPPLLCLWRGWRWWVPFFLLLRRAPGFAGPQRLLGPLYQRFLHLESRMHSGTDRHAHMVDHETRPMHHLHWGRQALCSMLDT